MREPDENPQAVVAVGISWFWNRAKLNPLFYAAIATVAAIVLADRIGWDHRWKWVLLLAVSLPALLHWKNRAFLIGAIAASFALIHSTQLKRVSEMAPVQPGAISTSGVVSGSTQKPADSEATLFRFATGNLGSFLVRVNSGGRNLQAGDRLEISGFLIPDRRRRNPNEFDFGSFLHRNRLSGKIRVEDDLSIDVIDRPTHVGLDQLAERCRTWLIGSITSGIPPDSDSAAVIKSMVLGASDSTPPELEHPFRYSGTMHLFAISGLHVGIFTSILWFALRLLNVRKDHAVILLVPAVFFYAFITGWRPSAVRAAVMLSVVLIGSLANRQPRLFNSLGAAALIVLIWDTHQVFLPGFQLSFTVLFTIALLADPFRRFAKSITAPDPFLPRSLLSPRAKTKHSILNYLGTYISVSLAAWLGSVYPVWYHFGLVTPVSVIANLVLIPAAFTMLSLAALSASLSLIPQIALPALFNKTNALLAGAVLSIAGWFADLPGAHFHLPKASVPSGVCTVTVLDVGYGGACNVIEPPGAPATLIDTGSEFDFHEIVRRFFASRGIDQTASLLLTHPDSHHIGGTQKLLALAPPSEVYTNQHASRSRLLSSLTDAGYDLHVATSGDRIGLSDSTSLEILYPPPGLRPGVADNTALVTRLEHGPWRILFMSDSGFETEKYLLESGLDLESHVIVMGRHRSDHSGTQAFIRAVSPAALVTTSSVFPQHENVSGTWRNNVISLGVRLFDHSHTGAVTIEASPESLVSSAPSSLAHP